MKDLTHLEVAEYFQIMWKRRWYIVAAFVLLMSGAVFYSWRIPDIFKSETRVMVESPLVSEEVFRPTVRSTPEDRINSIREQLASRTFLERIIEQFQMYGYGTRPDFVMENAVKAAQRQIGIEKTSNSTFTISFTSTDQQFSQTVTRQLAQELIRISTSKKKEGVLATDQFIDEQLRQTKEALNAQGEKVTRFKNAHLGELPEQVSANMSALSGLHSQLNSIETAMHQAQERQKMLDFKVQERKRLNLLSRSLTATQAVVKTPENRVVTGPSPAEVELAAKKAQRAQNAAKYTPTHPDMLILTLDIERLEKLVQDQKSAAVVDLAPKQDAPADTEKIDKVADQYDSVDPSFQFEADNIKAELVRREKEKAETLQQIKLYQKRLNLTPSLDQELATLLREEGVLKAQHDNLQKQKFSSQMATTVETDKKNETYKIIDEANLPVKAEYPNRVHIILMGLGGGLLFGIGAAFGRELLDTTIGNEEEAKRLLNIPVLVTIPIVPKEKKTRKAA
jgi:polysaccharide chain length determinant protein (PEP-CTERM system associated)